METIDTIIAEFKPNYMSILELGIGHLLYTDTLEKVPSKRYKVIRDFFYGFNDADGYDVVLSVNGFELLQDKKLLLEKLTSLSRGIIIIAVPVTFNVPAFMSGVKDVIVTDTKKFLVYEKSI